MDSWTKQQWSENWADGDTLAPQWISGSKGPFLDSPVADLRLSLRDGRRAVVSRPRVTPAIGPRRLFDSRMNNWRRDKWPCEERSERLGLARGLPGSAGNKRRPGGACSGWWHDTVCYPPSYSAGVTRQVPRTQSSGDQSWIPFNIERPLGVVSLPLPYQLRLPNADRAGRERGATRERPAHALSLRPTLHSRPLGLRFGLISPRGAGRMSSHVAGFGRPGFFVEFRCFLRAEASDPPLVPFSPLCCERRH